MESSPNGLNSGSLIVHDIFPPTTRFGKVRVLCSQGAAAWTTGIKPGPRFGQQQQLCDILHDYFTKSRPGLVDLPSLSLAGGLEPWPFDMEQQTKSWENKDPKTVSPVTQPPNTGGCKRHGCPLLALGGVINQRTTALIQVSEIL